MSCFKRIFDPLAVSVTTTPAAIPFQGKVDKFVFTNTGTVNIRVMIKGATAAAPTALEMATAPSLCYPSTPFYGCVVDTNDRVYVMADSGSAISIQVQGFGACDD